MTKPCHKHPPEEYLLDYATGSLADPFALLVATHACMCPDCQSTIRHLENLGGFLALQGASTPLPHLLEAPDNMTDPCSPDTRLPGWMATPSLPHCLQLLLQDVPPPSDWQDLLPGIRHFPLCPGKPALNLLFFGKNVQAPQHNHKGLEMTLVLAGQLKDSNALLNTGDLAVCEAGDSHAPKASTSMDCLCLWATEADIVLE